MPLLDSPLTQGFGARALRRVLARAGRPGMRERTARAWLHGAGIEIGAGAWPLSVPAHVRVRYVDVRSQAQLVREHPELAATSFVTPDLVEDGVELPSLATGSQDFVIANHVLEHTEDPIAVLGGWSRVLAGGGILFVTVPLASGSFDRGRTITAVSHMAYDHSVANAGLREELAWRNLEHYREWLAISEPNILRERGDPVPGATPDELERRALWMARERAEIHYHCFSTRSFRALLLEAMALVAPALRIRELVANRHEAIAVLSDN